MDNVCMFTPQSEVRVRFKAGPTPDGRAYTELKNMAKRSATAAGVVAEVCFQFHIARNPMTPAWY